MKFNLLLSFTFSILFFSGCFFNFNQNQESYYEKVASYDMMDKNPQHIYTNLNSAIADISRQLKLTQNPDFIDEKVIVTSFIDLDAFNKTTTLGRVLSESIIHELNKNHYQILDYRSRTNLLVNQDGEFYLTRDADKLKDEIEQANILVGTYSKFDLDSITINARILDFNTGHVVSSARVVYTKNDCKLLNNCVEKIKEPEITTPIMKDS